MAERLPPVLPPGSVVRTWKDLNRPLLFALRLEKAMMFVAVSLIVLVAALALVADLALIISSKRPEIGILGTMGATPAALRRAFLLLGGLVAGSACWSARSWAWEAPGCSTATSCCRCPGGSTSSITCRSW